MKPEQFIREYGVEKAREVVEGWRDRSFDDSFNIQDGVYCNLPFEPTDDCETLGLFELKRLVESVDLVNEFDDLEQAKSWIDDLESDMPYQVKGSDKRFFKWQLVDAVRDYASIYGEGNE